MPNVRDYTSPEFLAAVEWARTQQATVDADQNVRLAGVNLHTLLKAKADYTKPEVLERFTRAYDLVMPAHVEHLRQVELRARRRSHFFGEAGGKKVQTIELTVSRRQPMSTGDFGKRTYWFFRHDDGRLVKWLQASGRILEFSPGQRVRLRGRVKAHLKNGAEPVTEMTYCEVELV